MTVRAPRPFRLALVLGAPGQGKTSLVREWVEAWRRERPGGVLEVLDPTCDNWTDLGGVWPDRGPEDARGPEERGEEWAIALRTRRKPRGERPPPALVILEDCDTYLLGSQPRGVWRDLFATFRHWRSDVIVIARRTQDVPKALMQSASVVAIFAHREVGATDYLRRYIGTTHAAKVPKEPHRYILRDMVTGELEEGTTKRLPVRVGADSA